MSKKYNIYLDNASTTPMYNFYKNTNHIIEQQV